MIRPPPRPTLLPCTALSRSMRRSLRGVVTASGGRCHQSVTGSLDPAPVGEGPDRRRAGVVRGDRHVHDRLVPPPEPFLARKSTRLNSSHANISYAVFCLEQQ